MLTGPEPTDEEGNALDPANAWGQDHCWWLDRMVRSDQQLVERMTFICHDWFANSNEQVDSQQLMLDQNEPVPRAWRSAASTTCSWPSPTNPAMLVFLNGTSNNKWDPNENYAREMMELFSLGADRGAYTEDDVREMARALTGWRNDWSAELGDYNFRFDPAYHDPGTKTVFGQTGNWNYEDAVRLCVTTRSIPPSSSPSCGATSSRRRPIRSDARLAPGRVLSSRLQHPGGRRGDPPAPRLLRRARTGHPAGRLQRRACCAPSARPIDTTAWAWLSANAGQQLFYPPNVSGWDFTRWLDTSTAKARWEMASYVTSKTYPNPWPAKGEHEYSATEEPADGALIALAYWANPPLSAESERCIAAFAASCLQEPLAQWEQSPYRAMRQNALRMLIATSPDMQVS